MAITDFISNFVVRKQKEIDLTHYEKTNWDNSMDFYMPYGMQYRQ